MSSLPPCLSWSTVAMRALTRVVFVPQASRRCCALAVALHRRDSGLGIHMHATTRGSRRSTFGLHEIFKCGYLNLRYMGTSKQTYIHTTSANAVTLVWGSLRFGPVRESVQVHFIIRKAIHCKYSSFSCEEGATNRQSDN